MWHTSTDHVLQLVRLTAIIDAHNAVGMRLQQAMQLEHLLKEKLISLKNADGTYAGRSRTPPR